MIASLMIGVGAGTIIPVLGPLPVRCTPTGSRDYNRPKNGNRGQVLPNGTGKALLQLKASMIADREANQLNM